MTQHRLQLTVVAFLWFAITGFAAPVAAAATATILFIGNSFTAGAHSSALSYRPTSVHDLNGSNIGGVPALFKTMATEAGLDFDVSHETVGSSNLDLHYEQKAALISRPWDHVVLQPYSTLDQQSPGDRTRLLDFVPRLARLFQSANPAVDLRLVATWSRADQTYSPTGHWYGQPIGAMASDLRAACDAAAQATPAIRAVIPVGQAWNLAIESGVAIRNPYVDAPPGQINLWAADNYHASAAGYYLEALVMFGSVTGRDPRLLGAAEQAAAELGIAPAAAQTLQRLAYETLTHETAAPAVAGPPAGLATDPCAGVPLQPTAAHQASANVYLSWMHDWLALDWGQQCRYQSENAALPAASPRRVVMLGDSITEGWKSQSQGFFSDQRLDRGISGQTTAQMLVRFRHDVLDLHPVLVHIMAGTNDIAGNTGPTTLSAIEGNIATMVELARAHHIDVVLASVPPAARFAWQPTLRPATAVAALNDWLRDYARREHLVYVDYYSALEDESGAFRSELSGDGVHPNAAGYAVMQPLAERAIEAAFRQRQR
jgi:lysophospholipase L1-like esterase